MGFNLAFKGLITVHKLKPLSHSPFNTTQNPSLLQYTLHFIVVQNIQNAQVQNP
jgi:hypothetical protein